MYFQTFPGQKDKFIINLYFSRFFQKNKKNTSFFQTFRLITHPDIWVEVLIYSFSGTFVPSLKIFFTSAFNLYLSCRILTDHLLLGNNIYRVVVTVFLFEISHVNMKNLLKWSSEVNYRFNSTFKFI